MFLTNASWSTCGAGNIYCALRNVTIVGPLAGESHFYITIGAIAMHFDVFHWGFEGADFTPQPPNPATPLYSSNQP
jgi:hypothetical protein